MGTSFAKDRALARAARAGRRPRLLVVSGDALRGRLEEIAAAAPPRRKPLFRFVAAADDVVVEPASRLFDAAIVDLTGGALPPLVSLPMARRALAALPLVVVTRDDEEEVGRAALDAGAQDHLALGELSLRSLERSLFHAVERFALHHAAESFRALAEAAPDPILVRRGETLLFGNRAFLELLGATSLREARSEPVGRWLEAMAPPPGARSPAARSGDPQSALLRTRRGVTVPVEVQSYRILFDAADATLSVLRDLAAREQRARSRAQQERLASLGRLAANLGHEINNPLSYVVSNLSYLGTQLASLAERAGAGGAASALADELDEARSAAGDALEGAERVAAIVRDVRVLSRIESRELRPLRVGDVIQSALRIARGRLAEVAEVRLDLGEMPPIRANDTALLQVFVNLLVNAADACAELGHEKHEVRVSCFTDDAGRAVIEIRDTGPGVPEDVRAHVFEPFFTTKPAGNGVGLAISYAIVESLAGTLSLESAGLRGAVARVVLPPVPAESPAPARVRASGRGRRAAPPVTRTALQSLGGGRPA